LACTSPIVIYGLERGNFDIIIFIMLVAAGVLSTGKLTSRILSYALMLLAGLLKFYPLIALWAVLRERTRTFAAIVTAAGLIIIGIFYRVSELSRRRLEKAFHPTVSASARRNCLLTGLCRRCDFSLGLSNPSGSRHSHMRFWPFC
jgi:hypothetical protein